MKIELFKYSPPWYKLIVSVFVIFSCLFITYLVSMVLAIPLFHLSFNEFITILQKGIDEKNVTMLKYLQFFQSVGAFLVPALLLATLFSSDGLAYLKIKKVPSIFTVILLIFAVTAAIPAINFTGFINSKLVLPQSLGGLQDKIVEFEKEAAEIMKAFLNTDSVSVYLVNLMLIAILPAICEEFIFRGIFQQLFTELTRNIHFGVFLTSFFFSFFHLQFFGFLPRFLLGLYFGYLLVWTGSIWVPVIAHFINNATAISVYFFFRHSYENSYIDEVGTAPSDLPFLIATIGLFIVLNILIYRIEKLKRPVLHH